MNIFKSIKNFAQEKSRLSACAKHDFYNELLTEEVNVINKNANLQEDEVEFYKKVGEYCIDRHKSLERESDIIEAIVMSSFNVPIAGIFWLDGWFESARYDQDRFTSDYVSIDPSCANKIMYGKTIQKGDYIVVIEDKSLELKKEIRDFAGRILRDAITSNSYFARLIKVTVDHSKEYNEMMMEHHKEANAFALKQMRPIAPNMIHEADVEQYNNLRQAYLERYDTKDPFSGRLEYYDYDVKGTVVERKYIKTLANLSFIHSKILQQEQVFNIGDIAYTGLNRKVKVLEKTEKGYLVEALGSGLVGEETRLYSAISAYFTNYFSNNKRVCALKWQKDKERRV